MIWQSVAPVIVSVLLSSPARPERPVPAVPVPADKVQITDAFWSARQRANAASTLRANFTQCEKTGRIENFVKAAKGEGKYEGYFFNDSDVYKAIEGACLVLQQSRDKDLEARLDALIATIAAAQQPDGYLNAYFTLMEPDKRWSNLEDKHELYCAGHLIEAGIAHHQVTGKRSLLDVALRFADHIDATFGPAPKRNGVCGHEEIELALLKLWQHTGEARYRDLAAYFLAQRGRSEQVGDTPGKDRELFAEYCQDHAPLEEQEHVVGHAVRAMYLYCAATDFARMTGDTRYVPALQRVWDDLTGSKMYVTGGIGSSATNEGFTTAYDLPNDSAYAETCAGIGLTMWGHRMALLQSDQGGPYMDVVERGLFNGVLSGVSQSGDRFFYVNPLASRGKHQRQEWFACACCPPNILRLVAQVGGMVYAQTPDALLLNLPVGSRAEITLPGADGHPVTGVVEQTTNYPWDGEVTLKFTLPRPATFDLKLRIPGWCRSSEIRVNDAPVETQPSGGYALAGRAWKNGDTVKWTMAMPVERMHAHPSVKSTVGRVALQRGPLVYCFESVDNPGLSVRQVSIPGGAELRAERSAGTLGGMMVIRAKAQAPDAIDPGALYAPADARTVTLTGVPYFAWANRDAGEMQVWMPEALALAERPLDPTITATASYCHRTDTVTALYDGQTPSSSADQSIPRHTFWPHKGTAEWVQYDFASARAVGGVEVYWFDDAGGCRLPESWRVMYSDNGEWKEAAAAASCPVEADRFTRVRFPAVRAGAVRLEIQLRTGDASASGGLLEWRVLE